MSAIKITPTKLKGKVQVPPSKSMAHRAIICSSLAKGKSRIDNIEYSKDIEATIAAMQALGTTITKYDTYVVVDGSTTYQKQDSVIDCKESGSTLRFMVPISIVKENRVHFIGEGNLGKRPLDTFYDIFDRQNIGYLYHQNILDLQIGGVLKPDCFKIPGNISSQFISGLLFALPLLEGDSVIEITSPLESKGYIDLTLQMLATFGIQITNDKYQKFMIKGNQEYVAHDYRVEADFSQAAFYLVAGALGNEVILTDLNLDSLQGDKEAMDILNRMGATIKEVDKGIQVCASNLQATTIDASQCPDVIPVITVATLLAKGTSHIINAKRLRIKECDRIVATVSQLNEIGGQVVELEEGMDSTGVNSLQGGQCKTFDDHRIAMMLAIVATVCKEPLYLDNKECVQKSYPSFWEDYQALGGIIDECNMEK